MNITNAYLGQGPTFPFVLVNGSLPVSEYQDTIQASIKHIVFWEYGNRFFQPTFGSRLWSLLGQPNDGVLQALVKRFLIDAISAWEGRITLLESNINMPKAYSLHITCRYKINATKQIKDINFQYNL
jgi:phage baseplate assembly protein W